MIFSIKTLLFVLGNGDTDFSENGVNVFHSVFSFLHGIYTALSAVESEPNIPSAGVILGIKKADLNEFSSKSALIIELWVRKNHLHTAGGYLS